MALKQFVNTPDTMAAFEAATSLKLVENVYQGEIFVMGKSWTGDYATQATVNADGSFQVDIMRVRMWDDVSRKLDPTGTLPNSNLLNTNATISGAIQVNDDIYTLKLDEVIDHPVIVPRLALSINHLQRIENFALNYALNITRTINTSRAAHYVYALINSVQNATDLSRNVFNYNPTTIFTDPTQRDIAYQTFIRATDSLLNGDISNGFQTFPVDRCQVVIRPVAKSEIGIAYLNQASDDAVKLLANGTANPFDNTATVRIDLKSGLYGLINGFFASYMTDDVWTKAISYFGDVAAALSTPLAPTNTIAIMNAIAGLAIAADACFAHRLSGGVEAGIEPLTRAQVLVPFERFGLTVISPYAVKAITRLATPLTLGQFTAAQGETSQLINPASQAGFNVSYN